MQFGSSRDPLNHLVLYPGDGIKDITVVFLLLFSFYNNCGTYRKIKIIN